MIVVGLTGGIGSGKTTVANFFKELGVPVYITDTEAKILMNASEPLKRSIIDLFGKEAYSNNTLDRKFIASQVFRDKPLLDSLNALVHPAVRQDFEAWKLRQRAPYVLYETAILFEEGGYKNCDFVILVTASRELKIERLLQRDQSSIEEIEARMAHQWSDEKKISLADFVIENNELKNTFKKVREIHEILLQTA